MCGIAGYWDRKNAEPADEALLGRMAAVMRRRGPDDSGVFTDGPTGFAHSRLAVIDLTKAAAQPFRSADGRYVLVYNGELFNAGELRAELEAEGFSFRSSSDTEVLLNMYIAHGRAMLPRLNGFFAFAIYDRREKTLFLARDRFGVKPLFYLLTPDRFAFASELAALRLLPFFEPDALRTDAVYDFLCIQYVPGEKTVYGQVFKLLPGHFIEIRQTENSFRIERWYVPGSAPRKMSFRDACAELRSVLTDAVERRLTADVPVGVFLSGGMDSRIVAGIAATKMREPLHAFSIGFDDPRYDESEAIRASAEAVRGWSGNALKLELRKIPPCGFDTIRELAAGFGEPYADASMIPFAALCAHAREYVTVALSGDGADELFYGYERYRAMRLFRAARLLPCGLIGRCLPKGGNERTASGRLGRFLRLAAVKGDADRYFALMTHEAESKFGALFERDLSLGARRLTASFPRSGDPADAAAEFDLRTYLPGDILVKADVGSMNSSLEVRSPFLDHRVAELAFSLPRSFKLDGGKGKRILAEAFADCLGPGFLRSYRKKGFGVPVADYLRGAWMAPAKELLLDGCAFPEGWFRREGLERLLAEHVLKRADHSYLLYSLLILALFFRTRR